MRNIKLTLQYDGSRYQGWTRLGKGESENTISNKIIEVIQKMTGEEVELFCGSRTEVGVHAHGQIANFKTASALKEYEIKHYLNRYLPMDIAVLNVEEKPERFHASLNATSRIYLYRVAVSEVPSVFDRKYTYYSFQKPDVEKMRQAALLLTGTHDFKDFSTAKKSKSTSKKLSRVEILDTGEEIQITLQANDFLHNMTRMLAATLLDVGLGKRKIEEMTGILDPKDLTVASAPADPKGLFLQEVIY
ncbi:MAG: tRNA pseudouridine(38-40) synthase TruA [Lachnospiraceae bacterium]